MDKVIAGFAAEKGIKIYAEYGVKEAAELIGVGEGLLRQAIKSSELNALKIGNRSTILGVDLVKWKLNKRTESVNRGSSKTETAIGVEHGMMNTPDSEGLQALALEIMN